LKINLSETVHIAAGGSHKVTHPDDEGQDVCRPLPPCDGIDIPLLERVFKPINAARFGFRNEEQLLKWFPNYYKHLQGLEINLYRTSTYVLGRSQVVFIPEEYVCTLQRIL